MSHNKNWEWHRIRGKAKRNELGRAIRMIGLIENIDKQKQISKRLDSAEKTLSLAMDNIPVGLQIWDKHDKLILCNERIN